MGMLTGAATVENTMEVSPKLKTELPYEPAIPLLGVYPDETVSRKDPRSVYSSRDTGTT